MAGELEAYISHFQAADAAERKLRAAIDDLSMRVTHAIQNPQILLQPATGVWPTQDELRALCQDAQAKAAPLIAEFNQVPQDLRKFAPNPQTVGR